MSDVRDSFRRFVKDAPNVVDGLDFVGLLGEIEAARLNDTGDEHDGDVAAQVASTARDTHDQAGDLTGIVRLVRRVLDEWPAEVPLELPD